MSTHQPERPREYAELTVRDGTGHTLTFVYLVSSRSAAIAKFKENCRRCGITKFKKIKILEVKITKG